MREVLVAIALLSAQSLSTAESVVLIPPKDTNEQAVKSAIPAMMQRCEVYGYSVMAAEIVTLNDRSAIRLSSPAEINEKMRSTLARLFIVSGQYVDLCQVYVATDAEKEQFKPGGASAPTGVAWAYVRSRSGDKGAFDLEDKPAPPILIYTGRSLPKSEMTISIERRTVEMKMSMLQKHKMDKDLILRIDAMLLWRAYGEFNVFSSSVESKQIKCTKCKGEGKLVAVRRISGGIQPDRVTAPCPNCNGKGFNIDKDEDVLRYTFEDRVSFAWVAVPMPFACTLSPKQ
jgi:hypothetical protein